MTNQYYFILLFRLVQFWSLGTLPVVSFVPLIILLLNYGFFFFNISYFLVLQDALETFNIFFLMPEILTFHDNILFLCSSFYSSKLPS